jgi:3-deoxy-7-phosphoheptulonate synthase
MEIPMSNHSQKTVFSFRRQATDIVKGNSDRLLVIVGPCSIHDPVAALEYGHKLKEIATELQQDLCIIMRAYFEKPRTTVGWKGLINDPDIDGSFKINKGLRIARQLLCDLVSS